MYIIHWIDNGEKFSSPFVAANPENDTVLVEPLVKSARTSYLVIDVASITRAEEL